MLGIGLGSHLKQVKNLDMHQSLPHGLETRVEGQAVSAAGSSNQHTSTHTGWWHGLCVSRVTLRVLTCQHTATHTGWAQAVCPNRVRG